MTDISRQQHSIDTRLIILLLFVFPFVLYYEQVLTIWRLKQDYFPQLLHGTISTKSIVYCVLSSGLETKDSKFYQVISHQKRMSKK